MIPRNAAEREVTRLCPKLKEYSEEELQKFSLEAYKDSKHNILVHGKDQHYCPICGAIWTSTAEGNEECPNCHSIGIIQHTKKFVYHHQDRSFATLETINGWQAVSTYIVSIDAKYGRETRYRCSKIIVHWLKPGHKRITMAKNRIMYGYWSPFSELSIKDNRDERYDIYSSYVKYDGVIRELHKHGYRHNRDCYGWAPGYFLYMLLNKSQIETMVKCGWGDAINHLGMSWCESNFNSIKVAMRHKYIPADFKLWKDTIDNLRFLGKDLRNPHYICPEDLHEAHNKYLNLVVVKREQEWRRQEEQRRRREAEESQKCIDEFMKKSKYFGIALVCGSDVRIVVLDSIDAYKEEGDAMHHCVFANRYFGKKDTLILSARTDDGKRLATIELNLKTMKVEQCRAACNAVPERYDELVSCVERNSAVFRKAMRKAA